jgi:hypothetical protein
MATRYWNPNAQATTMIVTFTVTATANGATFTLTCNGKSMTYTATATDTTNTVAAALLNLMLPTTAPIPPIEFSDATWTQSGAVLTATAAVMGQPFTFTSNAALGGTLVQATATANSSPSDVNNASNWLTSAGATGLPANGDDIILADTSVSLLWNADLLDAINVNSITIWNTFTGNIGLPEINSAGYIEYRPTYFELGATTLTVGVGATGSGSGLMRIDVGAGACTFNVISTGSPGTGTDYALRLLGSNVANVLNVTSGSVAVAMLPTETAVLSGGCTINGGAVGLGVGVTLAGTLTANNGAQVDLRCVPNAVKANAAVFTVFSSASYVFPSWNVFNGTAIAWFGGGTVTSYTSNPGGCSLTKADPATLTITNGTVNNDVGSIVDPYNGITYTNPLTITGAINSGIVQSGTGRTLKIT